MASSLASATVRAVRVAGRLPSTQASRCMGSSSQSNSAASSSASPVKSTLPKIMSRYAQSDEASIRDPTHITQSYVFSRQAATLQANSQRSMDSLISACVASALPTCLVSRPTYAYTSGKVSINMFYFVGGASVRGGAGRARADTGSNGLPTESVQALSARLTQLCQKEVNLRMTRIHYPYLNAHVFAQFLARNASSSTFIKFEEAILTSPSLNANALPAYISGIKIKLSGRLVTESLIPRMTQQSSVVGSFNNAPLVDYAKFTTKNELGAFTIKVWIGQRSSS